MFRDPPPQHSAANEASVVSETSNWDDVSSSYSLYSSEPVHTSEIKLEDSNDSQEVSSLAGCEGVKKTVSKQERIIKPDDSYQYHVALQTIESGTIVMHDFTIDKDMLGFYSTEELEGMVDTQLKQIFEMQNPTILQYYFSCYRCRYVYDHDESINSTKSFREFLYDKIESLDYNYEAVLEFYRKREYKEEGSDSSSFDSFDSIALRQTGKKQSEPVDEVEGSPDTESHESAVLEPPVTAYKVELETVVDEWDEFIYNKHSHFLSTNGEKSKDQLLLTWHTPQVSNSGSIDSIDSSASFQPTVIPNSTDTLETEVPKDSSINVAEQKNLNSGSKIIPLIQLFNSFSNNITSFTKARK